MKLIRRIGNTKYIVNVHFDETGTHTFEDRVLRLISRETLVNNGKCGIINTPQRGRPCQERTTS